jgi:hypothetical protein
VARQNNPLEFNNFLGGLITEAGPLNFPENASLDELNFNLFKDGSRKRRLGMDYEDSAQFIQFPNAGPAFNFEVAISAYLWSDAAANGSNNIAVVQVGTQLKFFNTSSVPTSSGEIDSYTHPLPIRSRLSYATIDGLLVVVGTGYKEVLVFEYDQDAEQVLESEVNLEVRDFWGIEDIDPDTGVDLRQGSGLSRRPDTLTDAHIYNLRNQSWAPPRRDGNNEFLVDPIGAFRGQELQYSGGLIPVPIERTSGLYPSHRDSVNQALFPDANDGDDRTGDRFWPLHVLTNPESLGEAPRGHFIIDLMDRAESRLNALNDLSERYSTDGITTLIVYEVDDIPSDSTFNGPTCVESFAGRVFYAGFDNRGNGGDNYSPKLASYVSFSQVIESKSSLGRCYQLADPTSPYDSEIVDTDGGIVRIDGAERIVALRAVGRSLLVFATNGVWKIDGGTETGFAATNYEVVKVSDSGTESANSIVPVENSVLYWSTNGIYAIGANEVGDLSAQNISAQTIQTVFHNIPFEDRVSCTGAYDSIDRKVRWVYGNRLGSLEQPRELVFDVDLRAFYLSEIHRPFATEHFPAAMIETPAFRVGEVSEDVVVGTEVVTVGAEDVIITVKDPRDSVRELAYITITDFTPTPTMTFSTYRDGNFEDWSSNMTIGGVDAPAFLLTGYVPGQDFQRRKQVPYITTHMKRTETGMELVDGDLVPANQSSCLMSARWDWSNSASSGKWTTPRQIYRYRRPYVPVDINDPYDNGFETVVSKNKLRGSGRVVSLKFETEPGKDCILYGWSAILGISGNV